MSHDQNPADAAVDAAAIAANLARVREQIAAAARAAGRAPADIKLIAVSKTHPADAAAAAIAAGQMAFGENRVQEAKAKFPSLVRRHPGLELHLIGPLQTNKAADAVALFDVIQTVDRPKLAETLAREMNRLNRRPVCYVEINTGAEAQKAGILPDAADPFIELCRRQHGLPIEGLMCIPPSGADPTHHFALLREIAARHGLTRLSMGMSGDYQIAVREGATDVRVGTAIFGARPAPAR
jgi:pyridoxal phosphate enzyme (YggS family)